MKIFSIYIHYKYMPYLSSVNDIHLYGLMQSILERLIQLGLNQTGCCFAYFQVLQKRHKIGRVVEMCLLEIRKHQKDLQWRKREQRIKSRRVRKEAHLFQAPRTRAKKHKQHQEMDPRNSVSSSAGPQNTCMSLFFSLSFSHLVNPFLSWSRF